MKLVTSATKRCIRAKKKQKCFINFAIECNRHSSLKKVILITGYVMRFAEDKEDKIKEEIDTGRDLVTDGWYVDNRCV